MNFKKDLLSFRYSKDFVYNKLRRKKLRYRNVEVGHHEACPLCGSTSGILVSEVDRIGFVCGTIVCSYCHLVFNDSYISNPQHFYSRDWAPERWRNPTDSFLKRTSCDSYSWKRMAFVAKCLGNEFQHLETVVEIGCGDGCNLFPYHLIGKQVTGFDFDGRYLAPGREHGMNLIEGEIADADTSRTFNLALVIHSLEHMLDLDASIREISKLLTVGGYVYVEVPGIRNWNRPISNPAINMGLRSSCNVLSYLQFQHNYHFDLAHLKYIWERNGFEMIKGDEWVRCIFKKNDSFCGGELTDCIAYETNIIDHLKAVERSVFSGRNILTVLSTFWRRF